MAKAYEYQSTVNKIRTVAIWGTGGIGKSQIALEYAHRRWASGTPVILWVASETEPEITKSFSEAAAELQLEAYSETNTPEKNHHIVIQWLQTTSRNHPRPRPFTPTTLHSFRN